MKNKQATKYLWIVILAIPVLAALQKKAVVNPAPEKRPNILFCIADDASLEYIGAYGCTWVKTPGFDRVAREGVLFKNAYTPNAKCSPSRACILTGRNSWQLESAGNHAPIYPAKFTTFMEALGVNGYQVGFTGKGWAPGEPGIRNGKPRQLTGPAFSDIKTATPTKAIAPVDYAANFEAFLKTRPKDKPFCFWYGGHEPHRVYEYGSGVAKGKKKLSDIDKVPAYWMDNEVIRNDMLDYAYEVEYFDSHLEKMLVLLERNGELENTIVVVTSDNGMPFPRVKGQVYEFDNHLPLAIMWKNHLKNPGTKIPEFVSFIDFAPTFLELAGVGSKQSGMQPVQGKSLLSLVRSGKPEPSRDHVLLGKERTDVGRPNDQGYPIRAIVKDGFMYIRNYETGRWPTGNPETGYLDCDGSPTKTAILQAHHQDKELAYWQMAFGKRGSEELYKISTDPQCMINLAGDQEFAGIKSQLQKQLEQELKLQQDPRMFGNGMVFDNYPYGEPKVRNFYERYMKGEDIKAGWVNESDFEKPAK